MLKMMCPNCHEQIMSALLAEIDEIACHHCHAGVPVRNVLISARGMTITREDLLKRFFRYKKLLAEIVEERSLMEDNADVLETSKKNADQFIQTLQELMAGARDHFRLQFSLAVPVRFRFDDKIQSGWLVNLSMVGACIETENFYFLPGIGNIIEIEFFLPGRSEVISLEGMVAWVKEVRNGGDLAHDIGIKFVNMCEKAKMDLWHLISTSVQEVLADAPTE